MGFNVAEFYERHKVAESYGTTITAIDFDNASFCRIKTNAAAQVCREYFGRGGDLLILDKRQARAILLVNPQTNEVMIRNGHSNKASVSYIACIKRCMHYKLLPLKDADKMSYFIGAVDSLINDINNASKFFNANTFQLNLMRVKEWIPLLFE